MDRTSIQSFQKFSTWWLLFLGIATYGVYWAHYMKEQALRINEKLGNKEKIPDYFLNILLATAYLSGLLVITYFFVDETSPLATASDMVDTISMFPAMIWGYMVHHRMNKIYNFKRGKKERFSLI